MLMESGPTGGDDDVDEEALMQSLAEFGISSDASQNNGGKAPTEPEESVPDGEPPQDANHAPSRATAPTASMPTATAPAGIEPPENTTPCVPAGTEAAASGNPTPAAAAGPPPTAGGTEPPVQSRPSKAPPRPPPVRYASEYRAAAAAARPELPQRRPQSAEDDLLEDLMTAFQFGKQAVKEVFQEVKQSVRDANSVEAEATFSSDDARLGLRVERRPIDDACEVTYVEPEGPAERVGVRLDDVVLAVNSHGLGRGYDSLLQLLTSGVRPLRLSLLRPQPLFNSPLHYKLEDEITKASRILKGMAAAPESEDPEARQIMLELLRGSVGLVFMTTIKAGGLVSGMGGTGILLARLPDGSWSAPVAVGSLGLSWGLQIGATLADVMIVFTKPEALDAFRSQEATELSLGPESGIAVGPVGRSARVSHGLSHLGRDDPPSGLNSLPTSLEGLGDPEVQSEMKKEVDARLEEVRQDLKPAYTYAHSKGLFVGVSLEGSALSVCQLLLKNTLHELPATLILGL